MYVAKIKKGPIRWDAVLFEKRWSDIMFTNEAIEIGSKRLLLHSSAKRWVRNEIIKDMFRKHELEIIDG